MTTTNTNTANTTASVGFWKRLWQGVRRLFKREKAACCAGATPSTPGGTDAAARETKAAA